VERLATTDARTAPVLVAALTRMQSAEALAALFDALGNANPAVRAAAAAALVAAGVQGAARVVGALAREDPDPEVRRVCSAALAGR
jgi:HEAT repeat protein